MTLTPRRRNKYGNRRVEHDGHWHASAHERERCWILHQRLARGEISTLTLQPVYPLFISGEVVARYIGDFSYLEHGEHVLEDAKSEATRRNATYRLKRRMVQAQYGITIRET